MNRTETNTWRKLQGLRPLKELAEIVVDLQRYISGYVKNEHFSDYSDETFLDDIIYGLGTAYSQKNEYAQGALKFRKELHKHLTKRIKEEDPEWLNQNS